MLTQPNYAIAALAATQRAQRAQPMRPFKANAGGPFRAAQPCPPPSFRAADDAAERVAISKRDAEALRASYASYRERF